MKKETIDIEHTFEILMSNIFGKKTHHGDTGFMKYQDWKRNLQKISKRIKQSLEATVITSDKYHERELITLCNEFINELEKQKSIDTLNTKAIEYMTRIIFSLIGNEPNNIDSIEMKESPKHPKQWTLNKLRTIQYSQNWEQKYNLIIQASKDPQYNKGVPQTKDLYNKNIELRNDHKKFIEWFKENHKDAYIRIFCI